MQDYGFTVEDPAKHSMGGPVREHETHRRETSNDSYLTVPDAWLLA